MRFLALMLSVMVGSSAMANEEPKYRLVAKNAAYEIRQYDDRAIVRTQTGDADSGFGKLFRYISGANTSQSKIAMTVPVTQSEKIAMTAPVTEQVSDGKTYMSFYLPAKYTLATAPLPTDPSVELATDKGGKFAVLQFSGRSSNAAFQKKSKDLRAALIDDGMSFFDVPIRATFNAPFTPGFMRRNEIMFRLK